MFIETTRITEGIMLTAFGHMVDTRFPFLRTGKIYLAISGGKDSMTLSHLLIESGIQHTLLHCNFGLRGKESDGDEQFLRTYALKHKLIIHVQAFDTEKIADQQKLSIQECARKLRYDWFNTFLSADENAFLLTAHHLDDSIETFFINLIRGTGVRGLSGIPPQVGNIVRPLSDFSAEDIYRYIDQHHIDYRPDSSNAKKDYLRNQVRMDLIPVLSEIEPAFRSRMLTFFEDMNDLKKHLDSASEKFRATHARQDDEARADRVKFPLAVLRETEPFLLEQALRPYGIHRKNLEAFRHFITSVTGSVFYTSTYRFLIDRDDLIIAVKNPAQNAGYAMVHKLPLSVYCCDKNISVTLNTDVIIDRKTPGLQQIDADSTELPLTIRQWRTGDRMQPLGMEGTRLVSDILADHKVDRFAKENCMVVTGADQKIICLVGFCINEKNKISAKTSHVLEIRTL
jgi:tRNA(Ile)-lysidine synthase